MPFINTKMNIPLENEKEKLLVKSFGEAISLIPGKSERWLMTGFESGCGLYFQGSAEPCAIIDVQLYGSAPSSAYDALTERLTGILSDTTKIPASRIYVKYSEIPNWGWNGSNF